MASKHHQSTLQDHMWLVLKSMHVCGLYHDYKTHNDQTVSLGNHKRQWWKKMFNSGVYSLCVILMLWFNFMRSLIVVPPIDAGFPGRVVLVGWYAQCASNATVMYLGCRRLSTIHVFFKYWNNIFFDELTSKDACKRQNPSKFIRLCVAIGWIVFLVNSAVVLYFLHSDREETFGIRLNIIKPFTDSIFVRIVVSVLHVLETGAYVLPVVLVVTLSHTIALNLQHLTDSFKQHISETVSGVPPLLQFYRLRHLKLCHSVSILDGLFMYLMAVCFASNIILNCFVLYTMINSSINVLYILINCFWLGTGFGALLSTSISSSLVNDALTLFEKKLTCTSVAFTVLKMIRVTKETILSIGGLFVTYFFLLIQFRIT